MQDYLVLMYVKVRKHFMNVRDFVYTFTNVINKIREKKVEEGVKKRMSVNLDR